MKVSLSRFGSVLVGRDHELQVLERRLDLALGDSGGLVLLAGEPGIGKTSLAAAAAAAATAHGMTVAWGSGIETEGAPAYWPWREVLVTVVREALGEPSPDLEPTLEVVARIAPDVLPSAPLDRADPQDAGERFLLFTAVARVLAAAATTGGLLVVLDDLHWADPPSILLLREVSPGAWRVTDRGARQLPGHRSSPGSPAACSADEEAARWYGVALEVSTATYDSPQDRCRRGLRRAEALYAVGEITDALEACREVADVAEATGDAALVAAAALVVEGVGDPQTAPTVVALCDRALRALPDDDLGLRSRVLAQSSVAAIYTGQAERAEVTGREALRLAERDGGAPATVATLRALVRPLVGPGRSRTASVTASACWRWRRPPASRRSTYGGGCGETTRWCSSAASTTLDAR